MQFNMKKRPLMLKEDIGFCVCMGIGHILVHIRIEGLLAAMTSHTAIKKNKIKDDYLESYGFIVFSNFDI